MSGRGEPQEESHRGRFLSLAAVLLLAVVLVISAGGREVVGWVFHNADDLIAANPRAGVVVFVVLSAFSAMLAFLSSAILLPVAIHAWGELAAFVLLWLGWLIGGISSYAIGKWLGRDVVHWVVPARRLSIYERRLAKDATFGRVLLFHLMVPSELPGYVLGLLKYPFRRYVAILAIAEIPFAAGAVYLGSSFVEGNLPLFMLLATIAVALSILTTRWFLRHGTM